MRRFLVMKMHLSIAVPTLHLSKFAPVSGARFDVVLAVDIASTGGQYGALLPAAGGSLGRLFYLRGRM